MLVCNHFVIFLETLGIVSKHGLLPVLKHFSESVGFVSEVENKGSRFRMCKITIIRGSITQGMLLFGPSRLISVQHPNGSMMAATSRRIEPHRPPSPLPVSNKLYMTMPYDGVVGGY